MQDTNMNIYVWRNIRGESDVVEEENILLPHSSNDHSGGIVVAAESLEEDAWN